jgi:hypothetical protein
MGKFDLEKYAADPQAMEFIEWYFRASEKEKQRIAKYIEGRKSILQAKV